MNKPKSILTIGISASGKTTWANSFIAENSDFININRDDIRVELMGGPEHFSWNKWKWAREKEVTTIQQQRLRNAIAMKKDIIVSDTNLNTIVLEKLISYLVMSGYDVDVKWFEVDVEVAIERDTMRSYPVGEDTIRRQYEKFNALKVHFA